MPAAEGAANLDARHLSESPNAADKLIVEIWIQGRLKLVILFR
jgi:hypothetical protein